MFLKQINSSLVDSNMLVRCVTLSLDRFENQVDMKGKKNPSCLGESAHCGRASVKHPASHKDTPRWLEAPAPNAHMAGVKVVALWEIFLAALTFLSSVLPFIRHAF